MANEAAKEAHRLRYFLAATNAASRSLDVEDKELTALLAIQSNTINRNYGGYPYDDQIHSALSNALNRYNLLPGDLKDPTQPVHTLIGVRGGSVFSIGKTGEVMRWTQSNNAWMSEQVLVVRMDVPITSVDMSPDARMVVVGRSTKTIGISQAEVYQLGSTEREPVVNNGFKPLITKVIFNPDGSGFYALHNYGMSISYCNLTTTKIVATAKEAVTHLALSTDGTQLAGAGKKGIYFWNTKDFATSEVTLPDENIQISAAP